MVPSEPYLNTEKLEQLEDLYDISKSSDKTLLIVTRTSRLKLKKCKNPPHKLFSSVERIPCFSAQQLGSPLI